MVNAADEWLYCLCITHIHHHKIYHPHNILLVSLHFHPYTYTYIDAINDLQVNNFAH